MTDEIERLRAAFSSWSPERAQAGRCPAPDEVVAAVHGELSAARRRAIVDHTSACASCAEDWRLAMELAGPVSETAATSAWWRGAALWVWGHGRMVSAMAAVVLVVAVWFVGRERPGEVVYRDSGGATIQSLLAQDEPVDRNDCVLRWTSGPDGARYDVQVTGSDLGPIASVAGLDVEEVRLAPEQLARVPAGATLFWQVTARLPDGTRVRSATFTTRLK